MTLRLLILGLSTFTRAVVEYAKANGDVEVVAVDEDEERMRSMLQLVDRPLIGDATSAELLRGAGVEEADHVLISMPNIETSLLCLLRVRELNAKAVTVRAGGDEHVTLLKMLGVDRIIFPEKQMAEIFGLHLLNPAFAWVRSVGSDDSVIAAIGCPGDLDGQSVAGIQERYGIEIVAVVRPDEASVLKLRDEEVLRKGDEVIVFGSADRLTRLAKASASGASFGRLIPWNWRAASKG